MSRTTRQHTIAGHLAAVGLPNLHLSEAEQKEGRPGRHESDGFAVRQHLDENGALVVIAGAYGPDWFMTLAQMRYRLERPYVKCTVTDDAPGLGDHEIVVRWATSQELQARKRAEAARQAPLVAMLHQQVKAERAAAERQAIEDAGQTGLW
ncbi:hypothetical protein OG413_20655 [Streptomyces sp. NBC_01433]|uniref:hypothetical protein n=1 Tax=Streptomyces sp. NBC_01433 TaxID=2903864 RepID=UPI0022506912|nr:hypothetical protein [Streptomyces sp. NBC_01433]MCX4677686.1 hypothetical protein [Streptomyces sp. NBC_01433]